MSKAPLKDKAIIPLRGNDQVFPKQYGEYGGIDLRTYIAAQLYPGIIQTMGLGHYDSAAHETVKRTDALIRALNEVPNETR